MSRPAESVDAPRTSLHLVQSEFRELKRPTTGVLRGEGRAVAVAKFRELARRIESGELDGARVQWRQVTEGNPDGMEVVELTDTSVQLIVYSIEA